MADYFLARHVHFCCRGDALIFLNLKQDNYAMVGGEIAAAVRNLYLKKPADQRTFDSLGELLSGGLLTTDGSVGKEIAPTNVELATEPLVDREVTPDPCIKAGHIRRFTAACTVADMRLRFGRIERTVRAVELRKISCASGPLEVQKARQLTAIFHRLRSFFPRDYLCLYDSLALIEFLARYDVFPTWVFGVKLEPWAAHCWVQEGPFIFNEDVEEGAGYTPIMSI